MDWRRTVLSKFFNTQAPSTSTFDTQEHVLPRHSRCVLFRLRYNGHNFVKLLCLRWAELRILLATHEDTCLGTPLISFCTVELRTLCAAHFLATLCLSTTSGPDPGELPGFWGSMVFRHAPIPRKGSGKNSNNNRRLGHLSST